MLLAPRQRKTTVFTRFWASASKNHGIYSVLWPGPSKNTGIYAVSCMLSEAFFGCQRHKNIVNYTIFTRGQYPKIMKNGPKIDQKTPNKDLQNASSNFTLFFPTPNPQKRENPSRLKDFRGGSAAGARPRVAKAMLSCHHYTARHRRISLIEWANALVPPTPPLRGGARQGSAESHTHIYRPVDRCDDYIVKLTQDLVLVFHSCYPLVIYVRSLLKISANQHVRWMFTFPRPRP